MSKIPVITMQTLKNCTTNIKLVETIPSHVICDSIITFDELKLRYSQVGLRFVADERNYEIKS